MTNPNPSSPESQTPQGGDPQGQTPTTPPQGQTPTGNQKTSIDSLPPDIQDYIKSLRADAKKYRDASEAEARAKQVAEEQRLKEQGEFKQLAEKHETRVKELEPVAHSYTKLAEQVNSQIDAETKEWPAEVKAFDPGNDAPIEQRMEWMNKSRPLIDKITASSRTHAPGNSPRPTPTGSARDLNQDQIKGELLKSGLYKAF